MALQPGVGLGLHSNTPPNISIPCSIYVVSLIAHHNAVFYTFIVIVSVANFTLYIAFGIIRGFA
jgi:hypothetical protein